MVKHSRRSQRTSNQNSQPQSYASGESPLPYSPHSEPRSPQSFNAMPEFSPPMMFSQPSTSPRSTPKQIAADGGNSATARQRPLPLKIMGHWLFWMTLSIAVTGGVAGFAGATLFKLPDLPNCPQIFWPTASASLRMYCAERAADKNTPKDLLAAIALVDELPLDHPLRNRVDSLIEQWSFSILALAEVSFQQGDLEGAIAAAKQIPKHLAAYEQVEQQIEQWQSTWAKAEKIYQEAEGLLAQEDLRGAFAVAVKLLTVDNTYWQTEQYGVLTDLIEVSRVDIATLTEARRLSQKDNVTDLLAAIKLLEKIQPDSRLYASARRTLSRFLEDLVDLGIEALVKGDSDTAIKVSRNLPNGVEFKAKAQDLRQLSLAISQAASGTIPDIEAAILQAQDLSPNRPLYSNAQELVSRWELEIKDVQHLTRAREMAALGDIPDLQSAIAEAERIGPNNPRFDEAERAINGWRDQVYTLQDQPYLDKARQSANAGSIRSLDAAIRQAELIAVGRPLYPQAQQLIQQWTNQIQTMQDRPYLNDALQFAARGNLPAAIAAAQQIRPNRALYDEAQDNVQQWQDTLNGDIFFQQAYDIAQQGTPSAWAKAIQMADQISDGHVNYAEAHRSMDRWGQNILAQAQQMANVSYQEAIAIANLIPQSTTAYGQAQLQIEAWQRAIAQQEQWSAPSQPIVPVEESKPDVANPSVWPSNPTND